MLCPPPHLDEASGKILLLLLLVLERANLLLGYRRVGRGECNNILVLTGRTTPNECEYIVVTNAPHRTSTRAVALAMTAASRRRGMLAEDVLTGIIFSADKMWRWREGERELLQKQEQEATPRASSPKRKADSAGARTYVDFSRLSYRRYRR